MNEISINRLAIPLVKRLCARRAQLNLAVERAAGGALLVDAGIAAPGGLEAGRLIAEVCLGGLGTVTLTHAGVSPQWPLTLHVHTAQPVLACLASQYAGWSLSHKERHDDDQSEGGDAFHALGSGPARALAVREPLFETIGYRDAADGAVLVLEVDKPPPPALLARIARNCGIAEERLSVILTPTSSIAGAVQVVARVLEVGLHKTHELGFPLADVADGIGSAPLPPPGGDFVRAMGRTNDAILFAGRVQLFVRGTAAAARELAQALPSATSRDYGRPFAEIFQDYGHDFFKIDPMLFSPAQVAVVHLPSGRTFHAGAVNLDLLAQSFAP